MAKRELKKAHTVHYSHPAHHTQSHEHSTISNKEFPIKLEKVHSHELEKKLIENLVELQKIQTNLAEKFDKLADQISSLLALFEMAARSFATHPAIQSTEKDKEFLDKIDKLLDQNKTIAKGLTLMEERIRERIYGSPPNREMETEKKIISEYQPSPTSQNRPTPRF